MNSLIAFLTVFHLFKLIRKRVFVSKLTRRLVYLGIWLPLGDYALRLLLGELWFYSGSLIFHSLPYHMLLWGGVTLLFWVYSRDFVESIRFLSPIAGVLVYAVFVVFSTEHLYFLAPFSDFSLHFNWINAGYLVPTTVAILLQGSKKWSEFSSQLVGRISILVLVVFLSLAGFVRYGAQSKIPIELKSPGTVSVYPANNLQTEWLTVNYRKAEYHFGRYHFVQGYQQQFESVDAFNDYELAQSVLMDESIRKLYLSGFKNPIINIETQKDALKIEIKELNPSSELLWIEQTEIVRNRSGLIVDFNVQYGTFF